jgi:tetratricopeptide (TPR) repeat protein
MYYRKGKYSRAVEELERASTLVGSDPVVLEHLGDAYWALEEYHKALAAYERSLGLDAESEDVLEKLEAARSRLGD